MSQAGADAGGGPSESPASNGSNLSFTARIAGWTAQNRWPVLAASILVISWRLYFPSWLGWLPRVGPALEDATEEPAASD